MQPGSISKLFSSFLLKLMITSFFHLPGFHIFIVPPTPNTTISVTFSKILKHISSTCLLKTFFDMDKFKIIFELVTILLLFWFGFLAVVHVGC